MNAFQQVGLLLSGVLICASPAVWAETKVIDDFDSYPADQAIATSATSTPWLRFGGAVEDNLVATATPVVDGTAGASIPIGFADGRFAVIARNFTKDHPLDLRPYRSARIDAVSLKKLHSTGLKLFVTDGNSTYASKVSQAITEKGQTFTLSLSAERLEQTDGSESLDQVLSKTSALGVQLENRARSQKPADEIEVDHLCVSTEPNASGSTTP